MKKLLSLTVLAGLMAASSAHADLKVAEFTFGESNSTEITVVQSLKSHRNPSAGTVDVGLSDRELNNLFQNLKFNK